MKRLGLLALLAGCSVADTPYPLAWPMLPTPPANDCVHFRGAYADRGETAPADQSTPAAAGQSTPPAGQSTPPSLTRELFGPDGPWEKATTIRFDFAPDDALEVTVAGEGLDPVVHRFSAKTGEFACDRGQLALKSRRWVVSDLISGRESVKIELNMAEPFLVAHVYESISGVMFLVVPLSGESARWYRFRRLKP